MACAEAACYSGPMQMLRHNHRWAFLYGIFLLLACGVCKSAPPLKIVIPPIEPSARLQVDYFYRLLELVLLKTEPSDGPFNITFYPAKVSLERSVEELRNGRDINLIWTATNPKREHEMLPVRVSLLRDLNSYRLLLIRKEDQARFDQVKTHDDLRKLAAGLGSQWPDADIMRRNGYRVVGSVDYDSLFLMLGAKRFDFFPRGLYEVFNEEKLHRDKGLAIEKRLMLYYEAPFYFFVNPQNTALADRLERGLKLAQADGSFDQLLLSIPGFRRAVEEQGNGQRRLLRLN